MKLALQICFAIIFCGWLAWSQPSTITNIALPFGLQLSLGFLFWPLAVFVAIAESNATNLTDGVDGLMGGLGAIAFFGLGAYLAPTYPELMIFCVCMSGSCLGFVAHNRNPAKVFMGDTGSLALGVALAAIALVSNTLWVLLIISGIFLIETKNWSRKSVDTISLRSPIKQIQRSNFALYIYISENIFLNEHHWGEQAIPIRNLLVMINNKPKEKFKFVTVKLLNELNGYINYFEPVLSEKQVDRITSLLKIGNTEILQDSDFEKKWFSSSTD